MHGVCCCFQCSVSVSQRSQREANSSLQWSSSATTVYSRDSTPASAESAPQSLPLTCSCPLPAGIPGCPYFSPYQHGPTPGLTPYDAQSAEDKLAYVWSLLLRNQTTAIPELLSTGLIFTESMDPTVHFQSDFMPAGRQKAVHGAGVVCRVRLHIEPDNPLNAYTGLLQSGSETAVLRLSSVLDPSLVHGPVPSIAIKFFKDGALSANFVALNSEAPQVGTPATAAARPASPSSMLPIRADSCSAAPCSLPRFSWTPRTRSPVL